MITQISTLGRIEQTSQKIASFRNLKQGWHFGRGSAPSEARISQALTLNSVAGEAGFTRTNAFAGIDGEIRVTAYDKSIYLELTIESDGGITHIQERDGVEVVCEQNLSLEEVCRRIRAFRGLIWLSSGLYITTTTIPILSVSKVWPSETPAMEAEYPLSIESAYSTPAQPSANTLIDSIGTFLGVRQYSGISTHKFSQRLAA